MVQGLPMWVPNGNWVCMTALCSGLEKRPQGEAVPRMQALLILYQTSESAFCTKTVGDTGFVPVQPNDSLGLSQGHQGTCRSFQQ